MSTPLQHTIIRASAGSGKTYQLANRYLALLLLQAMAGEVAPERLVAITFTRKGAGEFADRILRRLAKAAENDVECNKLYADLSLLVSGSEERGIHGLAPGLQLVVTTNRLQNTLAILTDEFDRLVLSTIDSFMARAVQTLAFELGLDGFEILESPAADLERKKLLAEVFRRSSDQDLGEFYQTVKRATLKSASSLLRELDGFIESYHKLIHHLPQGEAWGGTGFWDDRLLEKTANPWREGAQQLLAEMEKTAFDSKEVGNALARCLTWLAGREPGLPLNTNSIPSWMTVKMEEGEEKRGKLLQIWPNWPDVWQCYPRVNSKKPCLVSSSIMVPLKTIIKGWLAAESLALATKTKAIYEIVSQYEGLYEKQARRKGRLSFDDVPVLLNQGDNTEAAERAISTLAFRWYQKFDHWLLDEFQDTSRVQWGVLSPWLDEVIQDDSGTKSAFVVGDSKQSIYGWRGGEPRLFDELTGNYPGAFKEQIMAESWRSRPAVLELVNLVCNPETNPALQDPTKFPEIALARWRYDHHSPEPSRANLPGYAAVLVAHQPEGEEGGNASEESGVGEDLSEKLAGQSRTIKTVLEKLEPLKKGLSCAILVRTNDNAQAVAQWLRAHGVLNVMVEGNAKLADQAPVVAALVDALRWLQTPANTLAAGHVQTTPLWDILTQPVLGTEPPQSLPGTVWRYWRERISEIGATEVTCQWCGQLSQSIQDVYSRYCLRHVDQLAHGTSSRISFPDWLVTLEQLEVRETAAPGSIHVMTIHKAKGLGFDVVFLPDLDLGGERPDDVLIRRDDQGRALGCLVSPPKWLCAWIPALEDLKSAQQAEQDLEALCVLYVALTRAKEATFVIMSQEKPQRSSRAREWLLGGIRSQVGEPAKQIQISPWGDCEVIWEAGIREISSTVAGSVGAEIFPKSALKLLPPLPRRERRRPSEISHQIWAKHPESLEAGADPGGLNFGTAVHQVFQQIEWWQPGLDLSGEAEAVAEVKACLEAPAIRAFFIPESPHDEACRELPLVFSDKGIWWSGMVDRLILRRDADRRLVKAVVIDFKTDKVKTLEVLRACYTEQVNIYRRALVAALKINPTQVETVLLSTHLRQPLIL